VRFLIGNGDFLIVMLLYERVPEGVPIKSQKTTMNPFKAPFSCGFPTNDDSTIAGTWF